MSLTGLGICGLDWTARLADLLVCWSSLRIFGQEEDFGAEGLGPSSSIASTTLSSVEGRPSRTLSAPREFLLPAGAERSIWLMWVGGVASLAVLLAGGVWGAGMCTLLDLA
jgi:hypothetical protein